MEWPKVPEGKIEADTVGQGRPGGEEQEAAEEGPRLLATWVLCHMHVIKLPLAGPVLSRSMSPEPKTGPNVRVHTYIHTYTHNTPIHAYTNML